MSLCQAIKYFSMKIKKLTLSSPDFPDALRQTAKSPKQLYYMGAPLNDLLKRPRVAIVGSRRVSIYGEKVTKDFASKLAEQGVLIISGLALGVDAMAHEAALESGGVCIAVLPSPLDRIVPANNQRLADEILANGGALVSEYAPGEIAYKQNFVARNRIMSGLAEVVLITEASEKSGTLHTAKFAIDQGREVFAVPGRIYDQGYEGANNLLKTFRAGIATDFTDILIALKLDYHKTAAKLVKGRNDNEQTILDLLLLGISDGELLLQQSAIEVSEFNQALTMLEIGGKIRPLGANNWAIF